MPDRALTLRELNRATLARQSLLERASLPVPSAIERTKQAATLTMTPFEPLAKPNRDALAEEAERLVRFVEADAQTFAVRFTE